MSNVYHAEIEEMNKNIRNIMNVWLIENYEPSLRLVAKEIDMNEMSLSNFLKDKNNITPERVNDILEFIMREELRKNNRKHMRSLQHTSESVREALNEWADNTYNPNLRLVSEVIEVSYPMLIQFKNNKTNLGKENLKKVYDFLKEQV